MGFKASGRFATMREERGAAEELARIIERYRAGATEPTAAGQLNQRLGEAISRFRNPWQVLEDAGVGVPRLPAPLEEAALAAAPFLGRMFPAVTAVQFMLLLRELSAQMVRRGSAPMLLPPSVQGGEGQWVFTENWVSDPCEMGTSGPWSNLAGGGTGCGSTGEVWMPGVANWLTTVEDMQANGARTDVTLASFSTDEGQAPGLPDVFHTWRQGKAWVYVGPFVPAPAEEEWPVFVPGAPVPAFEYGSAVGLGAPNDLSNEREALAHFGLPNSGLARRGLGGARLAAVHAFRESIGLREVTSFPQAEAAVGTALAEPSDFASAVEMASTEVFPVLQPAEPFTWTKVGTRAREAKLRLTPSYFAATAIVNAVTESNDFVHEIWKALPRSARTARLTRSGNRRTDAMLRDLYNSWNEVDWDEASVNLKVNSLEDQTFGALGRLATAAGLVLRRGGGQGGLGTQTALNPYGSGWGSGDNRDVRERSGAPVERHPISQVLDWYRDRQLSAVRRARAASRDRGA